ncbi:SufD family Fe-S cluster assembly protein [Candidatus Gottesmanbacteria bacterium]|nr:SufD family Fe-S cluster assembly protein [Candidatus Gottesmanbacteria bacterium]
MIGETIIIDKLKKGQEFNVFDAEKKIFLIFLTDANNQHGDVKIQIQGKNAHVQILGLIIGSGDQQIKLYTFQDHQQKESVSDLFIKSVLFDKSRFHYEGLIKIEKGAQKSNAYQKNQNLIMSPQAWAESKPYLEILANDVRCTHGATIGRLDKEQLYYLETRGLSEKEATTLLVQGFCQDILDRLPDKNIKDKLQEKIEKKVRNLLN